MWIQRIIIIGLIVTSGCSFALTKKPSTSHTGEVSCRSSWTWPVVDTALAGLMVGEVIVTAGESTNPGTDAAKARSNIITGGVVLGAAAAASAVYGYYRVSQCKGAKQEQHLAARPVPGPTPVATLSRPPVTAPIVRPAPAVADREIAARAHAKRGDELFDAGSFSNAIVEYKAAFAIEAQPKLLYNIASAYDELHDNVNARDYYQRYVDADPGGKAVDAARQRIVRLAGPHAN